MIYVNKDGAKMPASPEDLAEIEALKAGLKPAEMTEAERIAELEAQLSSMAAAYQEGVQSA